jgi:transcription initiation factor TFIIIB Brf1 subunit/transcription initiation factor TFIIB
MKGISCPRCGSERNTEISPYYQNKGLKCSDCGLVFNPSSTSYESDFELYHPGICGRCGQRLPKGVHT